MGVAFFLKGQPGIGKSTLILQQIKAKQVPYGGFAVQRLNKQGQTYAFRLLDLWNEDYIPHLASQEQYDDIVIYGQGKGQWQGNLTVFNTKGVQSLKIHCQQKIIIMDELGVFESKATQFQKAVFQALNSPLPVLGVLKNKESPFLDAIAALENVEVFLTNKSNLTQAQKHINLFLEKELL